MPAATETGRKVDEAFIERMRELVRKVGSIAHLAEACDLSESAIRKYLAGAEPSRPILNRLAEGADVPLTWLSKGVKASSQRVFTSPLNDDVVRVKIATCPRVKSDFSSLSPDDSGPSESALVLGTAWIRNEFQTDPSNVTALRIEGDNMEPTLKAGEVVLVDRSDKVLRDGSMFAILWENVLRIKRVQPLGKGICRLFSDNPAFAQDSIQMSEKDGTFSTVGRVIGVMRRF
jgi:phage repressor protein C with HTH and peptisase S24 domain